MKTLYVRPIRLTTSGVAIDRPCLVTNLSVTAQGADLTVNLRNGGATSPIYWTIEADASAGSQSVEFCHGLKFEKNVYIEMLGGDANSSVCIAVNEP